MAAPPLVGAVADMGRAPADLAGFYAAQYPRLVGALSLYCGDRDLAAELAQEAMARACRHWPRVRHFESPAGWVHRVGINLANNALRGARLRRRTVSFTPEHAADDPGTAMAVRAAVAGLPRRQRTALVLRYFVDLSVDDVAGLMRCSPGTVKALTSQAIAKLRAHGALEEDA